MAVFETWLKSDLKKPVKVKQLEGNLFSADNGGNLIGVEVLDGGQAASLSGGVTGYIIRADGLTVVINGSLSGNRASITLPASAYVVVGQISIVIKVGNTTVGACVGYVYRTTTDAIVDPGRVIPSMAELLAQIATMQQLNQTVTIQEAGRVTAEQGRVSAESARVTAEQRRSTAESARDAAETRRAADTTAAIAAAEAATGDAEDAADMVENITVAANGLAPGSQPTATVTIVDGHLHIVFGSVKGDPGKDFVIRKTFSSIAAMQAYDPDTDPSTKKVRENDFVMIDTGSVQDVDTGKLFCYEPDTIDVWRYIGDLSGSQGIKGETGTGIDHVTLNADYTLTVYYDDGTSDTTTSIRGATGATPNITIGTVVTLQPNQNAYVQLDHSSTPEAPVFNFGIPQGETGQVENVYGSTVPMSPSDSTKVKEAIDGKLGANQGSANAGKYMKVGNDGTLTPDTLDIGSKADKDTYAVVDNFAAFDANGNPVDSGHKHSDYLTQHQDISGKADKVQNATANNLAGLDANGNLKDSGKAASDFVAANQGAGNAGKALGIDNTGAVVPVPIVNNLTTDDATKALSAAMGKELNSKIAVIDLGKVPDLNISTTNLEANKTYRFSFSNNAANAPYINDGGYGFLGFNPYSKDWGRMVVFSTSHICSRTIVNGAYGNWVVEDGLTYYQELTSVENGLAYRETGTTASRNISDGEYVFWNGAMYKANGNIASGTTLVSGTNLIPTENALNALNSKITIREKTITGNTDSDGYLRVDSELQSGQIAIAVVSSQGEAFLCSAGTTINQYAKCSRKSQEVTIKVKYIG